MEFVRSAAWIAAYWALGEGLAIWLHLPIPGSVISLLLLYLCLRLGIVKTEWVIPGARGLLSVLGLLFVPTGAGVVAFTGLPWVVVVPTVAVLAALVIGLGGWLTQRSLKP
ncbi:MAG: CidA/LrgA family protein [Armatimonas sp.]